MKSIQLKKEVKNAILIGGLFWVLSVPLGEMIYHDAEVGMMMKLLAPLAPIMYLESVVVGVLKGLDQQAHSLLYSVLDSGSRIGLIIVLLPKYGIWGFYGVMVFSNLLTCLLNVYRLLKVSALRFRFGKWLIKPIISILLAVFTSELPQRFGVYSHLGHISQCILTGIVISGIYIACVWYMRCIEKEDMLWIQPISAYIRKSARN